jgi:hypothetical protein
MSFLNNTKSPKAKITRSNLVGCAKYIYKINDLKIDKFLVPSFSPYLFYLQMMDKFWCPFRSRRINLESLIEGGPEQMVAKSPPDILDRGFLFETDTELDFPVSAL